MRTKLFEWAERQKFEIEDLAEMTGYSERHLYRIKALVEKSESIPEAFASRVIMRMGDWARSLFLPDVSVPNDRESAPGARMPSSASRTAQERVLAAAMPDSSFGAENGATEPIPREVSDAAAAA